MKSLLMVRHAKSSIDIDADDFDRTLSSRGHRDAPEMAERLKQKKIAIHKFISSPAKRAFTTATYFANAYNTPEHEILKVANLYEPTIDAFLHAISLIDDSVQTVAVFSHNPAITTFINSLTDVTIDDMPTCGIYAVHIESQHWKDFTHAKKRFWFFEYPKAG